MTFIRKEREIDSVGNWLWLEGEDGGAWGKPDSDGPVYNWHMQKEKVLQYCNGFHLAIQGGGCMGMYPRLLSNMFGLVYTFEPSYLNFHCLVNNCPQQNIIKFNAALGESSGWVKTKGGPDIGGGGCSWEESKEGTIPQMSIDSFRFPRCNLIMLDTEGYEEYIIRGAVNTIKKCEPVIFAELGHREVVRDQLTALNYVIVDQTDDTIFVHKNRGFNGR